MYEVKEECTELSPRSGQDRDTRRHEPLHSRTRLLNARTHSCAMVRLRRQKRHRAARAMSQDHRCHLALVFSIGVRHAASCAGSMRQQLASNGMLPWWDCHASDAGMLMQASGTTGQLWSDSCGCRCWRGSWEREGGTCTGEEVYAYTRKLVSTTMKPAIEALATAGAADVPQRRPARNVGHRKRWPCCSAGLRMPSAHM